MLSDWRASALRATRRLQTRREHHCRDPWHYDDRRHQQSHIGREDHAVLPRKGKKIRAPNSGLAQLLDA
jgi:hypothetical protein